MVSTELSDQLLITSVIYSHPHSLTSLAAIPRFFALLLCVIPDATATLSLAHTLFSLPCDAAATTRGDKVGEVARSTGGAAVTAYGKAKDVAEKYHVSEKISSATKSTVRRIIDFLTFAPEDEI